MGAILAGGAGRRMGGAKPARMLAGRPLVAWPAAALSEVCDRVAIVAKPGIELPRLDGVELWDDEPAEPRHPLTGLVHALERAGEAVLVCGADMPFVTAAACRELIAAMGASATVAYAGGRLQPLLAVYTPAALQALRAAPPDEPLTRTVESLEPVLVELPEAVARGVDTPEALAAAEAELAER